METQDSLSVSNIKFDIPEGYLFCKGSQGLFRNYKPGSCVVTS